MGSSPTARAIKKINSMNKFISYVKSSFDEVINKVTWPKYGELQSSTILVLVASIIFALAIAAMDWVYKGALGIIYEG